ncbi:MAG: Rpp14/Pop5 family protein [archaeon]
MRRGQRYFLVAVDGPSGNPSGNPSGTLSENWQARLSSELEKILGRGGLGAVELQFVREREDGTLTPEKPGPGKVVLKCSVKGQRTVRGALALVTELGGVPARIRTLNASGTLKGLFS